MEKVQSACELKTDGHKQASRRFSTLLSSVQEWSMLGLHALVLCKTPLNLTFTLFSKPFSMLSQENRFNGTRMSKGNLCDSCSNNLFNHTFKVETFMAIVILKHKCNFFLPLHCSHYKVFIGLFIPLLLPSNGTKKLHQIFQCWFSSPHWKLVEGMKKE